MRSFNYLFAGCVLFILVSRASLSADSARESYVPAIDAATGDAEDAISRFQFAEPFQVQLFAAEPLLAHPVQLTVDDQGRVFVAETYRQGNAGGVLDNREHMYWLEEDLAAERVEDRADMIRRHRPEMIETWTTHHDVVRLLEDTTGDGRADQSKVFADGFNDLLDGTGAGVISRGGKVWYTNIPHLWLLEDTDGDGHSDRRESLSYGYGVTVSLRGHDLHGPVLGPDGRLYFSIGDRGYNVVTREGGQLKAPSEGAVFRCHPDGTNLEVFATGLRNPQGLAFDELGNLFTGDNNSDAGDRARWVYVVEGGDSGWRMPYQTLPDRGPFMREELWKPRFPGQPAWHIPPIANVADGPSGIAFNPGTGFPEKYAGYFFLCDFRAAAERSGIWALANEPDGAGFKLVDRHRFVWNLLATDVAFGPDGSLYISDWVQGWWGVNRGRVYRLFDPDRARDDEQLQVRELLRAGLAEQSLEELLNLIGHPNQRLRQEAQFELAQRGGHALPLLAEAATDDGRRLARIHAIWALWQMADREGNAALDPLLSLLEDPDAEIRAQAARVLGDKSAGQAASQLIAMLEDSDARPVFFAALALGRIGAVEATDAVVEMLRRNNDEDLYLRHAGVMALTGVGKKNEAALLSHAGDPDSAVRLGVLLALRRLNHPGVAFFLEDPEALLVSEAAAAINDTIIEEAQPALAGMIETADLQDERVLRRAINANFRMGGARQAQRVAAFAARADAPVAMRVEALEALGDWHRPGGRDRVTGFWRPLPGRPEAWPATAVDAELDNLLAPGNPGALRAAAIELISEYKIKGRGIDLLKIVQEGDEEAALRSAGLLALASLGDPALLERAVETATASQSNELRREAYGLLPQLGSSAAVSVLEALLASETSTPEEKQTAVATLREMDLPDAEAVIHSWFRRLMEDENSVPREIYFELIQAASQSRSENLQADYRRFQEARGKDVQAVRKELLYGGDVALGREVVLNHQAASCQRCHVVEGRGSSEVGPDLTGIGSRMDRRELLESLVAPNAVVASGYGAATFGLVGGESISGSIIKEDAESIVITTLDGEVHELPRSRIISRQGPFSAMPPMGHLLTDEELRAVVAYLASLKDSR